MGALRQTPPAATARRRRTSRAWFELMDTTRIYTHRRRMSCHVCGPSVIHSENAFSTRCSSCARVLNQPRPRHQPQPINPSQSTPANQHHNPYPALSSIGMVYTYYYGSMVIVAVIRSGLSCIGHSPANHFSSASLVQLVGHNNSLWQLRVASRSSARNKI